MLNLCPTQQPHMPTNIYLFHGKDNYTAGKKLTHWREEFEKKFGDLNIHIFEGGKLTAGEFNEAICTLPFLSDKKLIIIQDFLSEAKEEERKNLTEYLDKVPEHCLVIFIEHKTPDARTSLYKKLSKIGQNIEFKDLEKPELIQWIKKHFNEKIGNPHRTKRSRTSCRHSRTESLANGSRSGKTGSLRTKQHSRPTCD